MTLATTCVESSSRLPKSSPTASPTHSTVPMRWEENPQLSNWVSKQRHQFKLLQTGRPSRLDAERVKLLDDCGFVWEASRKRLLDGGVVEDGGDLGGSRAVTPKGKKRKISSSARSKRGTKPARGLSTAAAALVTEMQQHQAGVAPTGDQTLPQTANPPGVIDFSQAQALMAAGQGGLLQANFGFLAAMAGQVGLITAQVPNAVANPATTSLNPQIYFPLGNMVPFAAGLPVAGAPFPVGQVTQASPSPNPLAVEQPSGAAADTSAAAEAEAEAPDPPSQEVEPIEFREGTTGRPTEGNSVGGENHGD